MKILLTNTYFEKWKDADAGAAHGGTRLQKHLLKEFDVVANSP